MTLERPQPPGQGTQKDKKDRQELEDEVRSLQQRVASVKRLLDDLQQELERHKKEG